MLLEVKKLHGDALRARDGEIGRVDEILFDDDQWTVRYLVVDTGGWLNGRKVLIAPAALGAFVSDQQILNVNLTRDQVEGSPWVETDEPVSRQLETDYYDYYAMPYYWGGMGISGVLSGLGGRFAIRPDDVQTSQPVADERARDSEQHHGDVHLRSTRVVTGYGIVAQDGRLGHVEDFIVDDETWRICYLAVDTRDWWPGKKVLLPPDWIKHANWPDRTVTVDVTRDQVRNGPEWDPREPISRAFENELSTYYARQRLSVPERPGEPTEAFGESKAHSGRR